MIKPMLIAIFAISCIIALGVLLITFAVYLWKKFLRLIPQKMQSPVTILCIIALCVSLVVYVNASWEQFTYDYHMNQVPRSLGNVKIVYAKEKLGEFWKGENTNGVIAYQLSPETVKEIEEKGMNDFAEFFAKKAPAGIKDKRPIHERWIPTPVADTSKLLDRVVNEFCVVKNNFLATYLNRRYCVGVKTEPEIEAQINQALSTPGSYYTHRQSGSVFIIAPKISRAFFIYVY